MPSASLRASTITFATFTLLGGVPAVPQSLRPIAATNVTGSEGRRLPGNSPTTIALRRTVASVIEEKRRFAERWPGRTYRYRPGARDVVPCKLSGRKRGRQLEIESPR